MSPAHRMRRVNWRWPFGAVATLVVGVWVLIALDMARVAVAWFMQ
jgi:hypothetical protein